MQPDLHINAAGWAEGIKIIASPNCDERPANTTVDLLVLHHISLPPRVFGGNDVAALFTNTLDCQAHPDYVALQALRVSAHFFIRRDGELIQFVSCAQRAWHAGISRWCGRERCNDFSIGVELEGHEYTPYTEAQYLCLTHLILALKACYPIHALAGHQDIAPERKTDPGPFFHWQRVNQLWQQTAGFQQNRAR